MHHFDKPHGLYKAVKSNATRTELVRSRKRRPTLHDQPPTFCHLWHRLTRLASSRISITMTEEARAHTGRWIKSGARYCTPNHADTFFLLAVITSRFRLAKHACWNARDYEELVLWLVKNRPIPAAQWIPPEEHVNRRS